MSLPSKFVIKDTLTEVERWYQYNNKTKDYTVYTLIPNEQRHTSTHDVKSVEESFNYCSCLWKDYSIHILCH